MTSRRLVDEATRNSRRRRPGRLLAVLVAFLIPGVDSLAEVDRTLGAPRIEAALEAIADEADRLSDSDVTLFYVMAVWGRIHPVGGDAPGTQRWDPVLQVAEGDGVAVLRELRFEPGDRVHPQRVRDEVAVRSVTGPHVDGVVFQVAITADDAADAYLRFQSLPISLEIPIRDLSELDETHAIDGTGNGLMLTALRRPPTDCASGFWGGRWAATGGDAGVFHGVWRTLQGAPTGYLAGRWGVTRTGESVFHGEVIDKDGRFIGVLSGEHADGTLRGELFGRGGVLLGGVRGVVPDDGGHGLFQGAWHQVCSTP